MIDCFYNMSTLVGLCYAKVSLIIMVTSYVFYGMSTFVGLFYTKVSLTIIVTNYMFFMACQPLLGYFTPKLV